MVDPVLELIATYGVLGLGVALLLAATGLPIPTGALLLAVGALARDGVVDWPAAVAVALAGAVLGDLLGYGLGRLASGRVVRVTAGRHAALWQRAQALFQRHGALAVWSTRFLLTSLDKPTSVIAGGVGYDLCRFVACSVAGRAAWLALYGGVGYAFGGDWHAVSQAVGSYGGPVAAAAVVAGGLYLLRRHERTVDTRARSFYNAPGNDLLENVAPASSARCITVTLACPAGAARALARSCSPYRRAPPLQRREGNMATLGRLSLLVGFAAASALLLLLAFATGEQPAIAAPAPASQGAAVEPASQAGLALVDRSSTNALTLASTRPAAVRAQVYTTLPASGWVQSFGEDWAPDGSTDGEAYLQVEQPDGTRNVQITDDAEQGFAAVVAAYPRDTLVAAWWKDGIEYVIMDRDGKPLIPITRILDDTTAGATLVTNYNPVVAVAPNNGQTIIVWQREGGGGAGRNVSYAIRDAWGREILPPTALTTGEPGTDHWDPTVAAFADGRFVIAWRHWWEAGGESFSRIISVVIDNDGTVLAWRLLTDDRSYLSARANRLVDGNVIVVWSGYAWGSTPSAIYYAVLDSAGNLVRPSTALPDTPSSFDPDAVGLRNGNILVAWEQLDVSSNFQIYYTLLDSSYEQIGARRILVNPLSAENRDVSIARDADDNAVLTWWERSVRDCLYYAVIDHDGGVQIAPAVLRFARGPWFNPARHGHDNGSLPEWGLTISKTAAPNPVRAGSLLTYTLVAENSSLITMTDVTITDVIPTRTRFAHADAGGALAGDHVEWLSLTVPAKSAISVTFAVTVAPTVTVGVVENVTYGAQNTDGGLIAGTPVTTLVTIAGLSLDPAWNESLCQQGHAAVYPITVTSEVSIPAGLNLLPAGNAWPVTLWAGGIQITHTGPVSAHQPILLTAQVEVPAGASAGDEDAVTLWATPTHLPVIGASADLRTVVKGSGWVQGFGEDWAPDGSTDGEAYLQLEHAPGTRLAQITDDADGSSPPVLAALPRDTLVTAWVSRNGLIDYTALNANGDIVIPITRITPPDSMPYAGDPALAVAPTNGNVLIAWRRVYWASEIYYAVRDAAGGEVLSPTVLADNPWDDWSASNPTAASFDDGHLLVAWTHYEPYDFHEDLSYVQVEVLDDDSSVLFDLRLTGQGGWGEEICCAYANRLADGNVLVTWSAYDEWDDIRYLYCSVIDSTSRSVLTSWRLTATTLGQADAVGMSNGNTLIAWHDVDTSSHGHVYYSVLDSSYTPVGPTRRVLAETETNTYYTISLARDSEDNAVVTWSRSQDRSDLYYALIDHNGTVLTWPMRLRSARSDAFNAMRFGHHSGSLPELGLSITKTAVPTVAPGAVLTYTLLVENVGLAGASGVTISDTIPAHTTFAHAAAGGLLIGGHVEWLSLTVQPGEALSVTFAVTVAPTLTAGAIIENISYGCASAEGATTTGMPVTTTVATIPSVHIYVPVVLREH